MATTTGGSRKKDTRVKDFSLLKVHPVPVIHPSPVGSCYIFRIRRNPNEVALAVSWINIRRKKAEFAAASKTGFEDHTLPPGYNLYANVKASMTFMSRKEKR